MEENRILVIDDDAELCELLGGYLGQEGFVVESVSDGAAGLERTLSGVHALVVLDVMLPEMNGFGLSAQDPGAVRRSRCLCCDGAGRRRGQDRRAGDGGRRLPPQAIQSARARRRIRAVMRRAAASEVSPESPDRPECVRVGDVELSPQTRVVRRGGEVVELTSVELRTPGGVAPFRRGCGVAGGAFRERARRRKLSAYDRSVDVHMSSLRRKLGHRVGEMERIKNIRGVGYMYVRTSGQDA